VGEKTMQRRVKAGEQRHGERQKKKEKRRKKAFYWSVSLLVSLSVEHRQTQKKKDGEPEI